MAAVLRAAVGDLRDQARLAGARRKRLADAAAGSAILKAASRERFRDMVVSSPAWSAALSLQSVSAVCERSQ
jgi:hypothetical protein